MSNINNDIDTFPQIFVPIDFVTDNYRLIKPIVPPELKYEFKSAEIKDNFGGVIFIIFIVGLLFSFKEPYVFLPIWTILAIIVGNHFYHLEKKESQDALLLKKQYDKIYYDQKNLRDSLIKFETTINTINYQIISNAEKRLLILSEQEKRFEIDLNQTTFNRTGYSENYFYEFLCDSFGKSNIKRNTQVNGYTPDFIYIDANNLINLVIEIDEPYILDIGEPIHFDGVDNLRNQAFLEINWGVIRFTEMQVIQEPLNCVETIKSVIDVLLGVTAIYMCHNNLEIKWSYESAKLMADNYIREKYLGIPINNRTQKPKFYIDDDDDLPF